MSIVSGENCLLEFYDDGEWKPYACARSITLSTTTDTIEVSVKGSGKFKHYTPTVNAFTGNADGVTHLNKPGFVTLYQLRQFQLGHVLNRCRYTRMAMDGVSYYNDVIDFFITNVTDTSSFDNISTFTISLQGTGVLGQTLIEPPPIVNKMKRYEYTATGGELGFTEPLLINKDIIHADKDGIANARLITAGSPASKEVKYTTATGQLEWAVQFEPGEVAVIGYQDM